jgi:hypothetical protein
MRNQANVILSAILVCAALLAIARPASTQCILDPYSLGQNGQTQIESFYALVEGLYRADSDPAYDFRPTHKMQVNGADWQVPPWYHEDHLCEESNLEKDDSLLPSPRFNHYLLVSDQLSELAIVTALADNDERMKAIHRTIEALIGPPGTLHQDLPCWLAEVDTGSLSIRCLHSDSATDATARFGLAYYYAANNPQFPPVSRTTYREAADKLAYRHLAAEYARNESGERCYTSPVTNQDICHWAGGGAMTAAGPFEQMEMWIGYFPDVVRFLLAAYESTANVEFWKRAEQVVDQFLVASRFDGKILSFGPKQFVWDAGATPHIKPLPVDGDWDETDAPRSLWMGDVLRAVSLKTGGAPLTGAYNALSRWVELFHENVSQGRFSCIHYSQDGRGACRCSPEYYNNGLGAGMHTYHNTSTLQAKLDEALSQYGWGANQTWNRLPCFGIYYGIRPVKALAAAIGLDSTTYGGTSCLINDTHTLTVSKTGTGSGTVTSNPSGINCGSDCSVAYGAGTTVTLTASPAAGSTFTGWSGACSGTGSCQVTMDAAKSVTAGFGSGGSIPTAPTWLRVDTVSQSELKLTWQDNSNDETGFKVERKEGCCGPWTLLPDAPANSTTTATYQSTGLKCGTSYAYRVWAYNSAGESAKTNEAAKLTSACN